MNLEGKTALVTGSSRGIGKEIALKLAAAGANLVVNYIAAEEENALAVVEEIKELGSEAVAIEADVTDMSAVKEMVAEVTDQFETLDIVVNNAGITRDKFLLRMKEEDWQQVIDVNLTGTFNVVKAVTRTLLKQRSGRIINLASVVGLRGNAGQVNYSASKAGIVGLTKSTAQEFAQRGVTVNAVAPGFIETAMTDELSAEVVEEITDTIPMEEFGQAEDVANAVLFLASEGAGYITGEVIRIDGGMAM